MSRLIFTYKLKQAYIILVLITALSAVSPDRMLAQSETASQNTTASQGTNDHGGGVDKRKLAIHGNMRDNAPQHMSNMHRLAMASHRPAIKHYARKITIKKPPVRKTTLRKHISKGGNPVNKHSNRDLGNKTTHHHNANFHHHK
jgi:hypothetical protein